MHLRNFTLRRKVIDVELLDANLNYAWIKHRDGRQQTIDTRHLARRPRNGSEFKESEASNINDEYFTEYPQINKPIEIKNRFQELDDDDNPILVEDNLDTNRAIDFQLTKIKKKPPDCF